MSNESISAVFLGNFALLVGKGMICVLEKKWMDGRRRRRVCKTEGERERERERERKICVRFFSQVLPNELKHCQFVKEMLTLFLGKYIFHSVPIKF